MEKENIDLAELSLLTEEGVPEDADCVLIYAPQTDISQDELEMLQKYLQAGGGLFLITDPILDGSTRPNLDALMEGYGVTSAQGMVLEGSQNSYFRYPYYLLPTINSHAITSPLRDGGYYVLLSIAQGLTVSDNLPDGVSVTQLLTTSASAFSKQIDDGTLTTFNKEEGDVDGPFALAVAVTAEIDDDTQSNIVWVSSSSLLDDTANEMVSGSNQDLFLNALSWMCGQEEGITIHAKSLTADYLTVDSATASTMTAVIVAVIPLCCLGAGLFIWIRRKRQ